MNLTHHDETKKRLMTHRCEVCNRLLSFVPRVQPFYRSMIPKAYNGVTSTCLHTSRAVPEIFIMGKHFKNSV